MIRAVIFDLDGTLLKQRIDFQALRREIGAPEPCDIIEFVESLPSSRKEIARATLDLHERRAAAGSELNEGAREVLDHLRSAGLLTAVFTRNSRASLEAAMERHGLSLDPAVCRGDGPPKPSAAPVLSIARKIGAPPSDLLAVGDYAFDTESAIRAGAVSVFLTNGKPPRIETRAHFVIHGLRELIPLVSGLSDGSIVPGLPRTVEG